MEGDERSGTPPGGNREGGWRKRKKTRLRERKTTKGKKKGPSGEEMYFN